MDVNASDRDCSALGGLFHQIITDMKVGGWLRICNRLHVFLINYDELFIGANVDDIFEF